jgi:hypothetical protein
MAEAESKTKRLFIPASVIAEAHKSAEHITATVGMKFAGVNVDVTPGRSPKPDEVTGGIVTAVGIDEDGIENVMGRRAVLPAAKSLKAVG